MEKTDEWTKYDAAIAVLRQQDPGSYFDEIADLMEDLIARVVLAEEKPPRPTQRDLEYRREQALIKSALARRMASYSSAAKDDAE